jgi:hypothetical protein
MSEGEWMKRVRRVIFVRVPLGRHVAALAVLGGIGIGCGDATAPPKVAAATRANGLEHEPCTGDRLDTLDSNGDGKPEITRYFDKSAHEKCRWVDLNHDGKPDLFEYFDANGSVRRREFCYDDTGLVNAVEHYESGKMVRREFDINGTHRIDTWDWFDPNAPADPKTGRPAHPVHRERDTKGDGRIDQWWTWNGEQLTIAVDRDGDGKPDPEASLVFSDDGGPPAPTAAATDAGEAPSTGASNPPLPGGDGGSLNGARETRAGGDP